MCGLNIFIYWLDPSYTQIHAHNHTQIEYINLEWREIVLTIYCLSFVIIFISGGSNRLDDAVECYQRAANLFKMAKNWPQAGKAFCEAANLHSKAGSRHDAATNYVDASNCYKKSDTQEAVNCLLKAIEIYTDMGRFQIAAKHHQSIAELYENEANDLVNRIEFPKPIVSIY